MSTDFPSISVVVPARNEERFIARSIQFLLEQDYPKDRVEILVVVADSTDRTAEVVKEIAAGEARVKYLRNPYGLSSGARTLGAQAASGEIVIFVDGHVYIDNKELFLHTVRLMKEKQVSVLSRPQFMDTPHNSFFQRAVSLARTSWIGHGRDSTIYSREDKYVDPSSSGASYRKEVFEKIGYFDPAFDACEDVEFNFRCAEAGFRSFTSMGLAVYYYPRPSLSGLFGQMVRYGKGRFRLACKHPQTLSITTLFPSLLMAGLALTALAGFIWPIMIYLFGMLFVPYFAAILVSSAALAARNGMMFLFVLPAVYGTLHVGLGWGFICESITFALNGFRQPGTKKAPA